ncbi:MAG TPA: helix-turn-helix transcriptional regulator [Acidimicrobiia bacterium]|jgi:transcriptional regulator with XRE-family HTH domain|nr:helix-turn-helix transcriptional regulator [Acidimicrobiia bacterium]
MVEERFNRALGMRLRAARRHRGLSLTEVESLSNDEFKASVVGAYERGDRALSVQRLVGLADLYGVPVHQLIPAPADVGAPGVDTTIDLSAMADQPELVDRFLEAIHAMRSDELTEFAVRRSDLAILSTLVAAVPQAEVT